MQRDEVRDLSRVPVFNAPTVVIVLIGTLAVVHAGLSLVATSLADRMIYALAFVPARYDGAAEGPGSPWAAATSFLTHALVHGSLTHLLINAAWLLAVGTPLARRMSTTGFLAFFALCAAGGAVAFWGANIGLETPMVGASGAISGLMAAVFRLIYAATGPGERGLLREHPELAPRLSLRATLSNRACLTAIAVWVALNVLVGVGVGGTDAPGGIAWEAHLGGFLTGLLAFGLFDRGPAAIDRSTGNSADVADQP